MTRARPPVPMTRRAHLRALAGGAGVVVLSPARRPRAEPDATAPGSRPLPDMLDYMVHTLGPPRHARKMSDDETARYRDRVPPRLIRFWREQGCGSYFGGLYWICDPAPFDAVLATVFAGDEELDSADMTMVAYTAFGYATIWHRTRAGMGVAFLVSQVHVPQDASRRDKATGQRFPDDYLVATAVGIVPEQFLPDEHDFLSAAAARLGALRPGEIYGFSKALQLGGSYDVENLARVDAAEHLMTLARIAPMHLVRLTPPEPPLFPYGRSVTVRRIGPPH